jgi:hypothetical protein
MLHYKAKEAGFVSVHDYIVHLATGETGCKVNHGILSVTLLLCPFHSVCFFFTESSYLFESV